MRLHPALAPAGGAFDTGVTVGQQGLPPLINALSADPALPFQERPRLIQGPTRRLIDAARNKVR